MSIPANLSQQVVSDVSGCSVTSNSDESLKFAVAVALLRNKLVRKDLPASESDAQRWKKKAKERKEEVLRLREELRVAEVGMQDDLFPQNVACKCYFFNDVGTSSLKVHCEGFDGKVNDVLRRRFLRQVRLKERRKKLTGGSAQQLYFSDFTKEDGMQQFKASVDFLAELCENKRSDLQVTSSNRIHSRFTEEYAAEEAVEGIVSGLIMRMVTRMTASRKADENHSDGDSQIYIQHLLRKLGSNPFIGQRLLLSVSQRICALAESLLFADPFDPSFPNMHDCMFVMIQLIEFLILDHLSSWPSDQQFENLVFEEWVTSIIHARKGLELLETRNGLYILYIDRVIGQLATAVTKLPLLQKPNQELTDKLFY